MTFVVGLIAIAGAVAMLVFGKAESNGRPKSFVKGDFAASMYSIAILVAMAAGIALVFT